MTIASEQICRQAKILDQKGRVLRDLRISVTDRCNFRCPYCMPSGSIGDPGCFFAPDDYLKISEIIKIVRAATQLGVRKVRLTGGEPLLRPDLIDLIKEIGQVDSSIDIALTTNGHLLNQNVSQLKEAGLKRITISLNSLNNEIFQQMNGFRHDLAATFSAIQCAKDAGFSLLKINVVVQRGLNDKTILDLIEHFRGTPHILRFIEYMDAGTQNNWTLDKVAFTKNIFEMINQRYPLIPLAANYPGETAKRYAFKDGKGEIGFIASVSDPFCTECNRLRLTADGKLYTCLFASRGLDIKKLIRNGVEDEDISKVIKQQWQDRDDCYSETRHILLAKNLKVEKTEMYKIGG